MHSKFHRDMKSSAVCRSHSYLEYQLQPSDPMFGYHSNHCHWNTSRLKGVEWYSQFVGHLAPQSFASCFQSRSVVQLEMHTTVDPHYLCLRLHSLMPISRYRVAGAVSSNVGTSPGQFRQRCHNMLSLPRLVSAVFVRHCVIPIGLRWRTDASKAIPTSFAAGHRASHMQASIG